MGKLTLFDVWLPDDAASLVRVFEPMWSRGVRKITLGEDLGPGVIWTRTELLPQDEAEIMRLNQDAALAGTAIVAVHDYELPKLLKFWAWARFAVEGGILKCIKNLLAPTQGYEVLLTLGPDEPLPDYITPKLVPL